MTAPLLAAVGKLPVHGDFIRINHPLVPEILEIDRWLLQGIERGYDRRGRGFDAELRALPPLRLLYTSARTGRLWNGFVLPSTDSVGRVYPFVVGFVSPDQASGPSFDRLPLAASTTLRQIRALVDGAAGAGSLASLSERLLAIPVDVEPSTSEQSLRRFLLATTLDSVWANWPGFQQPERRQVCMQQLWGVTQPPFPPRYLTLVPLQRAASEACFWLSLLRQWAAVRANPAIVAWPVDEAVGPLRLAYDELHARYFEPLFWPDRADSGVLDVGRPTSARSAALPAEVVEALRPRTLLQDVILAAGRR